MNKNNSQKMLLMILDGWGIGDKSKSDVIFQGNTPYMDFLQKTYPHSQLQTSGENVGLPEGQMGNSEVGHLNIGAGRVVYQDLVKVNLAIRDNSITKNEQLVEALTYAQKHKMFFYHFKKSEKIFITGTINRNGSDNRPWYFCILVNDIFCK